MKTLKNQTNFQIIEASVDDMSTLDSIFKDALCNYNSVFVIEQWFGKYNDASVFKNGPGCWNCGDEGQFYQDSTQNKQEIVE